MNILILDDHEIHFRGPASFLVNAHDYRQDKVVQVSHPRYFWEEYPVMRWDEIWLDHDLGLPGYTGWDVITEVGQRYLKGQDFPERWYVTTMNGVVGQNMVEAFIKMDIDARRAPFSMLTDLGVSRGSIITDRTKTLRRN